MRRAASLEYDHREENPKPTDLNQVLNRGRGESIHKGMLQHWSGFVCSKETELMRMRLK
jgi:hypothetical protein